MKAKKQNFKNKMILQCFGILLAGIWFLPSAHAATVSGTIKVEGDIPQNPVLSMDADPVCTSFHSEDVFAEKVIAGEGGTLKNVFVYVKEGAPASDAPKSKAVLDQIGCMYDPHVMGVQAGQPISILNSDATLHNVHALGEKNPEFNLGMPMKGMKLEKTLTNPEVMVKFKCDVHPWMVAYIGVVPHHYFAVTELDGTFKIDGLSPGKYTLEIWHETYGTKTKEIEVTGDGAVADFVFSAKEINDEASGVSVKVGKAKPIEKYDDSAALNQPRLDTGWWLPESISTFSDDIDNLFYVILILTSIVFVGVQATLILFLFIYRYRKDRKAYYTHGSNKAEIIWTAIPAIILFVLAVSGQGVWDKVKTDIPEGDDVVKVRVAAEQFAWNIQYPGADGKFDTEDDIKNINQLHIPVGKPVHVILTSVPTSAKPAVLHSFFLPELRLKQDAVPGMAIDLWFEAKRTGKFEIACAEFCGLGHYRMRGFLSIHSQEGFEHWLKEQAYG